MEVRFSKRFVKDLKHLNKKHPLMRRDLDELIAALQRREAPGERLQGLAGHIIYKVRLKMSDSTKGKSAGYRVIYWLKVHSGVILLTIYAKGEQTDISADEVRAILAEVIQE